MNKSEETLKLYVDVKKKLHDERQKIEEHSSALNEQILELTTNVGLLESRNEQVETNLKGLKEIVGVSGGELTTEQLAQIVTVPDPISEKIMLIVAKQNALEDCMAAVKKAYEKDAVSISDFLKQIRLLSSKQCKQI